MKTFFGALVIRKCFCLCSSGGAFIYINEAKVNMESVFSRFDSYNFEADERFVDGLKTLNYRDQTELLKLKLFFYNRFVEPIDQQSYKQWISLSCNNQQDQIAQSNPDSNETETSADGETKQLSFAEVMQLVQEGKEVPGVTKPDVHPSNERPTPSQMQRVQKPWETTPS